MTENLPAKSEFEVMDDEDYKQILADDDLVAELSYTVGSKRCLSYTGIKTAVLAMSHKGQPLEVLQADVELTKHDAEDRAQWIWYATVKTRNKKNGHEAVGMSESPYLDPRSKGGATYDKFGRTAALSKAERNSYRKQIPEIIYHEILNKATKSGNTKTLKADVSEERPKEGAPAVGDAYKKALAAQQEKRQEPPKQQPPKQQPAQDGPRPPSDKQLKYLDYFRQYQKYWKEYNIWDCTDPKTMAECVKLIDRLKGRENDAKNGIVPDRVGP